MKKLLIGLAVAAVLIVVAVIAAPVLIPVDTYKEQIAQAARDATGRELKIQGDFSVSLLPRLELEAEDVAFASAPGADTPEMATLKALRVQLQVLPILSGEVQVSRFVLVEPVIHLEFDENGHGNWDFAQAGAAPVPAAAPSAEPSAGDTVAAAPALQRISLGDVRLVNGLVTFRDARSGAGYEASDVQMSVSLPDMDSPVSAQGSLVWNGEKVALKVEGESLRDLMGGARTPLRLSLDSAPVTLAFDGQVAPAGAPQLEGQVDLDVPSVRDLAAWSGTPLELAGSGLGPLKIAGKVAASAGKVSFSEARIALDDINATGEISADASGAKPVLKGRLDVDAIDVDTYMPAPGAATAQPAAGADTPAPAPVPTAATAVAEPASGWSDEHIQLDGLKAANVDFDLKIGAIRAQGLTIGQSALSASLKDGLLVLDLTELNLYGGTGEGKLTVDGRSDVPEVAKTFALRGIDAEPLLNDAAEFDRLEGTGQMDISVTARGRSQKAMVETLDGSGAIKFVDGAIKGINLAAMVRNVKGAFLDGGADETQKTDFAELSGTFKIDKGVLSNDDLVMLNPLLRLTGKGTANIPARTLDYRVEPKVVASLEGQGGASGAKGITVPVIIEGPWDDLSYRPDLAGLATEVVKDPSKALEGVEDTVKQLEQGGTGGLGDILKGVIEGGSENEGAGGGLIPDAGKTLKKLFGN